MTDSRRDVPVSPAVDPQVPDSAAYEEAMNLLMQMSGRFEKCVTTIKESNFEPEIADFVCGQVADVQELLWKVATLMGHPPLVSRRGEVIFTAEDAAAVDASLPDLPNTPAAEGGAS
jgi:hypothetical protein